MAENTSTFTGAAADGTALTAVYLTQPAANVAIGLVFAGSDLPRIVHWGRPLAKPDTLLAAYDALKPQRVSGALDDTVWPSILPTQAESWIGEQRVVLRRAGVELFPKFTVTNIETGGVLEATLDAVSGESYTDVAGHARATGPARVPGVIVTARDEEQGVEVEWHLELLPGGLARQKATVTNLFGADAGAQLEIGKIELGFPLPESAGELLFGGEVTLAGPGEGQNSYDTPWLFGSYGDGLNEIAARFHSYVRSLHPRLFSHGRPVILNTWEAVYFDHNFGTLKALADRAADSGVERFVVDDGWFGSRRDDTSGLGDWQIAQDVWPDGPKSLKALADYVHAKGMEFGLWFEPEMVNPDSDVARNHPDWILSPTAGRLPLQGRTQQVLDLTNPDAFDYIYGCMDQLVGELGIDYIKWDHNKLVTEPGSRRSGRPAVHAQTLAVYNIFKGLKTAHPGLEIESCSSGGGRVDLGILEHADRIWVSDCVDPVERADIQRYTSLLVPPAMMGEHVGASPAHSTQRATSQELRMAMAFFGHMGIEWNLLKEPDEALAKLAVWVAEFKKHRDWFAIDTCVHADSNDPAVRLDGMVMPNRDAAIYRFTQLTTSQTYPAAPVHLPGLDPERTYRVSPLDPSLDLTGLTNGQSTLGWWNEEGVVLTGEALQRYGIRPPSLHPQQAVLLKAVALS